MAYLAAQNASSAAIPAGEVRNAPGAMVRIDMDLDQDMRDTMVPLNRSGAPTVVDWVPLVLQGHTLLPASAPAVSHQRMGDGNSAGNGSNREAAAGLLSIEQAIGGQLLAGLPPAEAAAAPEPEAGDVSRRITKGFSKRSSQPLSSIIGREWQAADSPTASRTHPYLLRTSPAPCATPCSSSSISSNSGGSTGAASSARNPFAAGSGGHGVAHAQAQAQAQVVDQDGAQAAAATFRQGFELARNLGLGLNLNQLGATADLLAAIRDALEGGDMPAAHILVAGALSGTRAAGKVAATAAVAAPAARQQQ